MLRVVNMEHEMYNDGLYFYEQSLVQGNFGEKERCKRFAIVSFASSFEAFLNRLLRFKLNENPSIIPNGQSILCFLDNGFSNAGGIPQELRTIKSKIQLLEQLNNVKGQLINSTDFITFNNDVIQVRNAIVHYSHSSFTTVYSTQISNSVNNAANLLRNVISTFTKILNIDYPPYYNQLNYQPIL